MNAKYPPTGVWDKLLPDRKERAMSEIRCTCAMTAGRAGCMFHRDSVMGPITIEFPRCANCAELERHQAEDQRAIKRLSGLLARAVAALWDAPLNSEGKKWIEEVSLELSDGETVPAIQRAQEGK